MEIRGKRFSTNTKKAGLHFAPCLELFIGLKDNGGVCRAVDFIVVIHLYLKDIE